MGDRLLPPLAAALVSMAVVTALVWPVPLQGASAVPPGFFGGGHVWVMDHVAAMLFGERDWSFATDRIGWPRAVELRPLALVPTLLSAPLQRLVGPIATYNVVLVVSFGAAAVGGHALFRALGAARWTAAAGAVTYALCPFALGALSSGQLAKIQHWTLALLLLTWVRAARGSLLWALAAVPVAAALAFTAPTMALWAPLGGALLLAGVAMEQARAGWRPALVGLALASLALGATGAVLVLARGWFEPALPQVDQAFVPAVRLAGGRVDELLPVATLEALLWGPAEPERADWRTVTHVAALGAPALLGGLVLGAWKAEWRGPLLGVALSGALLALGPVLRTEEGPVVLGGMNLSLPAAALDAVGYPTARSGMYYRAALLGSLGLAGLLAGGCARLRGGVAVAWLVAALQVGHAVHMTDFLWRRPVRSVPGLALLDALATDPRPGAVLHLPARVDDGVGSLHLLVAAVHGRATTALPRNMERNPRTDAVLDLLSDAASLGGERGTALLRARGVRAVVWLEGLQVRPGEADRAALEALLGPGRTADGLVLWMVP